jgi:hypothetical protein
MFPGVSARPGPWRVHSHPDPGETHTGVRSGIFTTLIRGLRYVMVPVAGELPPALSGWVLNTSAPCPLQTQRHRRWAPQPPGVMAPRHEEEGQTCGVRQPALWLQRNGKSKRVATMRRDVLTVHGEPGLTTTGSLYVRARPPAAGDLALPRQAAVSGLALRPVSGDDRRPAGLIRSPAVRDMASYPDTCRRAVVPG